MEKNHIIFDLEKCVGCFNCMLACEDEHCDNNWLPYTEAKEKRAEKWINTRRYERGKAPIIDVSFVTEMCHHCENAECEKRFPDTIIRRDDGIVLIDAQKAKGNKELLKACPYGMIKWNEERQTAQKCTMCAHLLDEGWEEPRCVQACPLRALSIVKCTDEEFSRIKSAQHLRPLKEDGSKPRVLYKNLYKKDSVYIYGAVIRHDADGRELAIKEADVLLHMNGQLISSNITDFFGEFRVDKLPKNCGEFELTVSNNNKSVTIPVTVKDACVNVGVICLD